MCEIVNFIVVDIQHKLSYFKRIENNRPWFKLCPWSIWYWQIGNMVVFCYCLFSKLELIAETIFTGFINSFLGDSIHLNYSTLDVVCLPFKLTTVSFFIYIYTICLFICFVFVKRWSDALLVQIVCLNEQWAICAHTTLWLSCQICLYEEWVIFTDG